MRQLRLVGPFLAGAMAPVALAFSFIGGCGGDVCLVDSIALFFGVPIGAIAGVLAARMAPRDSGLYGLIAAVVGTPIGLGATLAFLGDADSLGGALPLVGPLLVGLLIAYAITRFVGRGSPAGAPAPPRPEGPA